LVVDLRDGGICQRCGKSKFDGYRIEWCHVMSRSHKSIQWQPWNTLALCGPSGFQQTCHFWFDRGDRKAARLWWAEKWPERAQKLAIHRATDAAPINLSNERLWLEQEIARKEASMTSL
jgi:hypothetical protein